MNTKLEQNEQLLDLLTKFYNLYIDEKKATNLSKNTIYNTRIIIERFYDFIADELVNTNLSINDINKYFLNNYLNNLTEAKINKNTQNLHLTTIKGFLSFIANYDINKYIFLKHQISIQSTLSYLINLFI